MPLPKTMRHFRGKSKGMKGRKGFSSDTSVIVFFFRVLPLESIKDAQAEISALNLESKVEKNLYHEEEILEQKESDIKQRVEKVQPESTLDDSTVFDDQDADHGMEYMETEEVVDEGRQSGETKEVKLTDDTEVVEDKGSCDKGGNAEELVSTARPEVSAGDERKKKIREKGEFLPVICIFPSGVSVSIKDGDDSSVKKVKKSDFDAAQIARDAEIAQSVTSDLQSRGGKGRQMEEKGIKVLIAESMIGRAKFLAETITAQRKFRAAQRSAEIRSRPPTKSQLRNLMMTYLKNMGGYKHSQLKANSFKEIKGMYERQKKSVQDFVPIGSAKEEELIKKMNEKETGEDTSNKEKVLEEPDSTKVEVKQEGHEDSTRKRPGRRLKMKATKKSKRQKTDSDLEEEEQLKAFLVIVPDEEGIIDYEVLEKRFPIINWESKFYEFDRHGAECIYYRIFRSDGSSRWIKTFSEMVTRFDRLDLEELYNLVMKRFETTTPEGVDLVLWGDLRTMFDANTEVDSGIIKKDGILKAKIYMKTVEYISWH
ncbi:hypothetical protein Tco_0481710 [Tanacetum coccineum]